MTPETNGEKDFPWWLLAAGGIGLYLGWRIWRDALYAQIFSAVAQGVEVTLFVTAVAFSSACVIGLALAVMSLSRSLVLRQVARFYIEVIRGIPILILLIYIAFVFTPALVVAANTVLDPLGFEPLRTRDINFMWRAIIALTIGYSAFIAEVFRAGIQSVDLGQIEAAEALGLNRWQRFRLIVLPQAIRIILPPLGNDFIAMIKDSSLVSVLGVSDISQIGKVTAAGNFRYFETYNIVAYIYLFMTIGLSLALRRLERRLRSRQMEES
ncbi:amino acid ABC transporter permease [Oceanibium sediminis]|uniref:amino acid ABC transporter permease n=1 Tax=Oceanibium sediminis TaxID=2026339 RepID=UPI000DD46A63|nr:amino acid ABC transporter permease [Oceanibium sediminis]